MFSFFKTNEELAREVHVEINYLTKLYGDDAGRVALEKAQRPRLRTIRRRVLQEAARQLARAEKRKRQSAADLAPTVPQAAVYAMDDDAHFRLSAPQDGWSRVEPETVSTPPVMADDDARFSLDGQEIVWSPVEPEIVPAPSIAAHDEIHFALPPTADGRSEPEVQSGSEPTPATDEVHSPASASPDTPTPAAPMPASVESSAPVRRAKRRVVSRATTFGIELEIDGVLVMFDARADAKVVSALVYALRDS